MITFTSLYFLTLTKNRTLAFWNIVQHSDIGFCNLNLTFGISDFNACTDCDIRDRFTCIQKVTLGETTILYFIFEK